MMSTINTIEGKEYSFTKGSLDSVLQNCSYYLEDNKLYNITTEYKRKNIQNRSRSIRKITSYLSPCR